MGRQPESPKYASYLVNATLGLVAFTQRYLLLPRRKPFAVVQIELPKMDGSQPAPRLFPTKYVSLQLPVCLLTVCRWTSKPWYKPRGRGLGVLADRLLVLIGMHDDVPRPEWKCEGYKIHELVRDSLCIHHTFSKN